MRAAPSADPLCSVRIRVGGRVQGVGYRPFVYGLARRLGVRGWVRNAGGEVLVQATAQVSVLEAFMQALVTRAPTIAQPRVLTTEPLALDDVKDFRIDPSTKDQAAQHHLPPDYFTCDACLAELLDPRDRRYRYPFINCTQCGPRYTLIHGLPYDRERTSMAGFALCADCRAEYEDPGNRRFHAEPLACPRCGPQLRYHAAHARIDTEQALEAAVAALRQGRIVAVKGVGGYHLLCDASNETAVQSLRGRKHRPHKPLALLFPFRGPDGLDAVRHYCLLDESSRRALLEPARPIVLLPRLRSDAGLANSLAPGLNEIGCMLPYSPLHHLLANDFGAPLVATSANLSGEPVLTDAQDVEARLTGVADAFIHHDRPILRPADDSVVRAVAGQMRVLRLGRGIAPVELPSDDRFMVPLLAVGGHMKNTVALGWERRLVLSPHIGDLDAPRSREVFEQLIADLQRLYGITPKICVHDAHPDYASTRWARQSGLETLSVPHHRAHASAIAGEYGHEGDWLVFTWDGTGLGEDGTLWGGETLLGRPGHWRRVASLRPFSLPGGERAVRQPAHIAAALAWETGRPSPVPVASLLRTAWQRGVHCPRSSAAGRLFDGAAAWLGLLDRTSFEAQAPMLLEAAARPDAEPVHLSWRADAQGILRCDWAPLLDLLQDRRLSVAERAGRFHASLAQAICELAARLRPQQDFAVGLSGGVFQNRLLAERTLSGLQDRGLRAYSPARIPCNDGGLSYGQLIEAQAVLRQRPLHRPAP